VIVDSKIRFAAKVKPSTEIRPGVSTPCLEWTANRNRLGYGLFQISGKSERAHRVAWEMANGPIPPGLCVLHRCDNPPCVNSEHLFLGTHTDNMHDMFAKGRGIVARARGEQNGSAKLTEEKVRRIFQLRREGWMQARLALEFGVSETSITLILSRKRWAHLELELSKGTI